MRYLKVVLVAIILFIFVWGLSHVSGVRDDVYLDNFSISEDGKYMTLNIGVLSEKGYVRKVTTETKGDKLYLDFHSTTGINNSNGAKTSYDIRMSDAWNEIYFYSSNKKYTLVLQKQDGHWYKYISK